MEYAMVDATIVKVHRHGQGAKGGLRVRPSAVPKGNLVRFELLPGHRFDTVGVPPLIDSVAFGALIADKAFDANAIIADLDPRGAMTIFRGYPESTACRNPSSSGCFCGLE
jgi:hypothetical protein